MVEGWDCCGSSAIPLLLLFTEKHSGQLVNSNQARGMADTEAQDQATEQAEKKKEKKVYRKDKPWDNDSIDHWKINEWTEDDAKASSHFLEVEPFAVYATVFCVSFPSNPALPQIDSQLPQPHSPLQTSSIPHCHCCRLNRPSASSTTLARGTPSNSTHKSLARSSLHCHSPTTCVPMHALAQSHSSLPHKLFH